MAGTIWLATATITDNYYNPAGNAGTGNVWDLSTDPYRVGGTTQALTSGATVFAIQMLQAGTQTLQFFDSMGTDVYYRQHSRYRHGAASQFMLLVPGENYLPGKPANFGFLGDTAGKSATPAAPCTAGQGYSITVRGTDASYSI